MPATVKIGTPLIVGDDELEEEYVADLMREEESYPTINPIVKVRFVLRYPMQHAIVWKDALNENRAIDEGVICRLHFYRMASAEEVSRFSSYAESLKAAQKDALQRAMRNGDASTAEIILRHLRGEYKRRRVLITFRRWGI